MTDYCVTGVNRKNPNDDRVSELKVWKYVISEKTGKRIWSLLGKKSSNFVADLLAKGDRVFSAREEKENGVLKQIKRGDEIEFVLRIAGNDEKFKITDMPSF